MSLDLSAVGFESETHEFSYDWKTVVLYNLGIGATRDELEYLFEGKGPRVYPTFAVIAPFVPMAEAMAKTEANPMMIVHGGQVVRMHRELPSEGTLKTTAKVRGIYDMKRMAQIVVDASTTINGEPAFDTEWAIIVRGEGGFGGEPPPKAADAPKKPDRDPDWEWQQTTAPEQALLYRLSGDLNPLHADPGFAQMAGFEKGPILHGLATYGYTGRAIIQKACDGDASKLKTFAAQFRKPVWPGEQLTVRGWQVDGRVVVETRAEDRPDAVITNCWAELA